MGTFERILVATDLLPTTHEWLLEISPLLARLRGVVDLAHVWRSPTPAFSDAAQGLRSEVVMEMERAASLLAKGGVRVARELLLDGDTERELVELEREGRYDLAVVGSPKQRFDSIASRMQRRAPCPVLTFPLGVRLNPAAGVRILVATDFSSCASHAAQCAIELARELEGAVTLLHVYSPPIRVLPDGSVLPPSSRAMASIEDDAAGEMAVLWHRLERHTIRIESIITPGDPVQAILAQAAAADLIVLGTHGRSGWKRLLLGSVAEKVARFAEVPVLTLREADSQKAEHKSKDGDREQRAVDA